MPHELKGFDKLPHDTYTLIIIGAVFIAVALPAIVAFFKWRHPSKKKPRSSRAPPRQGKPGGRSR
ncbi:MAG TPA: hypothetical protein VFR90_10485 [Methylibium sp.]|uniref:hypothetical protein n=1 Tax=Methylibium sp. TaxID=2067992 RepID=UPI002DB9F2F1|nr:hypothetical protein [Methylibium sp.]HEU4459539.1 hypothetical protein [Methylibium sp.]